MEDIYAKTTKIGIGKSKIVLKTPAKEGTEFKKMMTELEDKFGLEKLTREEKNRTNFWEIAESKPNIRKTYMELDSQLDMPFEDIFYIFMKNLDITTLPDLETIKLMDLSKPRCRRSEIPVNGQLMVSKDKANLLQKVPEPQKRDADEISAKKSDLINYKSFVIYFLIYQPNTSYIQGERNPPKPKPNLGVVLSSKNTLLDLRDAIRCENDFCRTPLPPNKMCKEIIPSGMFYINNTFYIDTRKPEYKDYSKVVQKWGRNKGLNMGDTFKMETTLISDLTVMINYPYLYQHLGNCEHNVMVKKIRYIHPKDSKLSTDYPMLYMIGVSAPMLCSICNKQPIRCAVTGSKRVQDDPHVSCITCYENFFLINGKPIEENAVCHPYLDRSDLTF